MKNILAIILFSSIGLYLNGQENQKDPYTMSWPPENVKIDTITTYLFRSKSILIAKLPNAKPTSNFSFETKAFNLMWMPVNTYDINKFIKKSLDKEDLVIDTLYCNVLGQNHSAVVVQTKRKYYLYLFQNIKGEQDVFLAKINNKKKIQNSINYITTNIQ